MKVIPSHMFIRSPGPVKIFAVDSATAVVQAGRESARIPIGWLYENDRVPPSARRRDPVTSKKGERDVKKNFRQFKMHHKLLIGYEKHGPGNFWDIGEASGVDPAKHCVWKRCSELQDMGLVREVKDASGMLVQTKGRRGSLCKVCEITEEGLQKLRALEQQLYLEEL